MSTHDFSQVVIPQNATAVLVLEDGTAVFGKGAGAENTTVAEMCFNTSMTGYQEIMTDPSYAGQSILFTFPHVGNVGANDEDFETAVPYARGAVMRADITSPSNWRAAQHFDTWLQAHNLPAICGVDTRALTARMRDYGTPKGVICHDRSGDFDVPTLHKMAQDWCGLKGTDLSPAVSCDTPYEWYDSLWTLHGGYAQGVNFKYHVVAIDYGVKKNILRNLAQQGCKVTVVPATTPAEDIFALKPDGVFLSNGPGDPEATGVYAIPVIQQIVNAGIPTFGICLGHQMLALAMGAKTEKMHFGHRGANHPIKDLTTGKVEITSQNHGFVVDRHSLPDTIEATHFSLFDKSLAGIRVKHKPAFSVQYHPEASPGPQDSHYLFVRFVDLIHRYKTP